MLRKCISKGWKFSEYFGHDEFVFGWSTIEYKDVDLPHDYIVGKVPQEGANAQKGFFTYTNAWYRKHFSLDPQWQEKRIRL